MLILINKQRVMAEAMELSRMKVAGILKVPMEAVHAQWERNATGGVVPNIAVEFPETPEITESMVRNVIKTVYQNLKIEMAERLDGLKTQRPERRKELFGREILH